MYDLNYLKKACFTDANPAFVLLPILHAISNPIAMTQAMKRTVVRLQFYVTVMSFYSNPKFITIKLHETAQTRLSSTFLDW